MQFKGAAVLITGGSSGIGAATAHAVAAAGGRPLIAGRDRARLETVVAQCDAVAAQRGTAAAERGPAAVKCGPAAVKCGAIALEADLAAPEGASRLAEAASRAAPDGIDVLVNNAGIGWAGAFSDVPADVEDRLVAVNLTAPLRLTRMLVPAMARRGRGHVVFVSSIAGTTGVRHEAAYSATKAGVRYFAESIRYELQTLGVGVSVVVPGVIDTPFFDRRGTPYQRRRPSPVPPERVARAILSAVERNRAEVFSPAWLRFPAWMCGTAPGLFRTLAARFG